MFMARLNRLLFPFLLLLFFVFYISGCSGENAIADDESDGEITFSVELIEAEIGEFAFTFQESGEIIPWRQAYIVPKMAGEVTAINAKSGDRVKKDDVILSVENTYQKIQLKQAEAGWKAMKAELEKLETLVDNGAMPAAELRRLKAEFEQLDLTLELARYAYDITFLKAPFDGVVSELMIDEGQLIGHEPVGRLVNNSVVKVRLTVTEDYVSNFYTGMAVDVEVPSAGFIQTGEVINIGSASVPETRSFLVEVKVNNPGEKLLPGMFATVKVSTDARTSVMVPASALYEEEGVSYLYVPDTNSVDNRKQKARIKEVKTGLRQDNMIEIISGISAGEKLILRPPPGFHDGSLYVVSGEDSP